MHISSVVFSPQRSVELNGMSQVQVTRVVPAATHSPAQATTTTIPRRFFSPTPLNASDETNEPGTCAAVDASYLG
jgi:hypothetical protein